METVRVLLISTYDLGRQPLGLASPAAWLRNEGVEVTCVDTSRDTLTDDQIGEAGLIAFYLPMHTATRLAAPLIVRAGRVNASARLAAYGLYAPLNASWLGEQGVTVLGPDAEADLLTLAQRQLPTPNFQLPTENSQSPEPRAESRRRFIRPDRVDLPPLARYASLQMPDGSRRVVGSTDATRGCKHLCRHCPIVPVYGGTFRAIPIDVVMGDVRAQVAAGAEHISFGDPDFFNGPTHARRIVEAVAKEFPRLTYDVTIKIEQILRHVDMLGLLRDTGCLMITSAVESID
ncbi:MAG TPA: CUAEP/CCAEP-tail radical SAM protein, partial [Vicinamibacterales bacterium]|nr:CUAEP/CCAEP-tail radical SAM protein [Vicinamibacterales bacterium]